MSRDEILGYARPLALLTTLVTVATLVSCAGSNQTSQTPSLTGTITTTLSDPPTCGMQTGGPLQSVWVTVTRVRAHISPNADPNASGWVDLVDLRNNPKQVDLLNLASTACVLTQLGLTTGLPPGNYQQIRFILLSNSPGSGEATPSPNACGQNGFNCAVMADSSMRMLELSSEAQTGIKVPPGQIAGGALRLQAGQATDINIDFDACASMMMQGNGMIRLRPVLRAGAVSPSTNSISGRVVDSVSSSPVGGALVLLEQPDSNGIDRVVRATTAASEGTFNFCPLPSGNYDIVIAASTTSSGVTTTYNATITFQVPIGTALGDVSLVPETGTPGSSTLPATITGQVTSAGSGGAASADVTLSAFQRAAPTGGPNLQVTIPAFGATSQPPTLSTASSPSCPAGTNCANYTLLVPGSNPQVGAFSASGTAYAAPAAGNVVYAVEAQASTCSPATQTSNTLTVTAGGSATTQNFAFTGCQ